MSIEGCWMATLTSLEVYNFVFNLTEENNKFELHTNNFDNFSSTELKLELEKILITSDITFKHLQHEIIGPRFTQAYKKLRLEKSSTDGYFIFLMGYARYSFRDFENYLRNVVGSDENDIQMTLKHYKSFFITYEISPAIYTIKDISEAVYTKGDHDGTINIDHDDICMKTRNILSRFGLTFGVL